MEKEVIKVVDFRIVEKKLEMADVVLPYFISNLKTKKDVARFLEKSIATIDNLIKDGRLIEDVHYYYEDNKLKFNPREIINWKINPIKKAPKVQKYKPSSNASDYV